MSIETLTNKAAEINAKISLLKDELKLECKKIFGDGMKELFAKYPGLVNFSWTQYTPYWCDGDPCEFSVNNSEIEVTWRDGGGEHHELEVSDYDWSKNNKRGHEYSNEQVKAFKSILNFIKQISDDVMEDMFGDHVKVIVTKDGATVEEFDHE